MRPNQHSLPVSTLLARWLPFTAAAAWLGAWIASLNDPHLIVDDAFISFRYAANLAHGLGLVYNPGERVEGYSNFLWTVLLAGGARLGLDLVPLSIVLCLLSALLTLAVLAAWSNRLFLTGATTAGDDSSRNPDRATGLVLAALPPLLYAAMGSQARYVLSGMETLLFGLLLLAASYLLVIARQPIAAGVVFALAAMTRPEGPLFAVLAGTLALALDLWFPATANLEETPALSSSPPAATPPTFPAVWPRLRPSILYAAGFAIVFIPYFVWRFSYYGYLFPNTYYVKGTGFSSSRLHRGVTLLADVSRSWSILPVVIAAAACAILLARRRKPDPSHATAGPDLLTRTCMLAVVFVVVTVLYFIAVGGDFLNFFGPRFLMPTLPFLLLLTSAGLGNLGSWAALAFRRVAAARRDTRADRQPTPDETPQTLALERIARLATATVFATLLLANAQWRSWPARDFDAPGLARLMASWEVLGRYIGAATPPSAVIADGGAGIVPYYSGRVNIDMYGLADLHIGHMVPLPIGWKNVAHEKYDPRYVLRRRPDYLITYLDRQATPRTAGLPRVKSWVWACYRPWTLLRDHPGRDGGWLLPSRTFDPELWDQGYRVGVLERRHGGGAARCAAFEAESAPMPLDDRIQPPLQSRGDSPQLP